MAPSQRNQKGRLSEASFRFLQVLDIRHEKLRLFITPMTSLDVAFVAHLSISNSTLLSTGELMPLADMKNLGVLQLIQNMDGPGFQINDRLVRGLCEYPGSFPMLRILRLISLKPDLTSVSLEALSQLPALAWLEVFVNKYEWKRDKDLETKYEWSFKNMYELEAKQDHIPPGYLKLFGKDIMSKDTLSRRDSALAERQDLWRLRRVERAKVPDPFSIIRRHQQAVSNPSHALFESDAGAIACPDGLDATSHLDKFAFWMYSLIGYLNGNPEYESNGLTCDQQDLLGPLALPTRPMASVFLGPAQSHLCKLGKANFTSGTRHWLFHRRLGSTDTDVSVELTHLTRMHQVHEEPRSSKIKRRKQDMAETLDMFASRP